jgi:hypothetical protein
VEVVAVGLFFFSGRAYFFRFIAIKSSKIFCVFGGRGYVLFLASLVEFVFFEKQPRKFLTLFRPNLSVKMV